MKAAWDPRLRRSWLGHPASFLGFTSDPAHDELPLAQDMRPSSCEAEPPHMTRTSSGNASLLPASQARAWPMQGQAGSGRRDQCSKYAPMLQFLSLVVVPAQWVLIRRPS